MHKLIRANLFTLGFFLLSLAFFNESAYSAERKSLGDEDKAQVVKALTRNEALHAAFFDYKAEAVEQAAKALKDSIAQIKNPEIGKILKFSQGKLDEIKASNERSKNDQAYHLVSMALIHIVNTYDIGDSFNAYSCPMVKKKWVQNSSKQAKVHNPYAPDMPHCGSQDTQY